jgi:hypothetical protein
MNATITYLLTEQAQRDAIKATGQPVARKQQMIIEVPAEDLDLFPIDANGMIELDLTGSITSSWREPLKAAGWAPDGHSGVAANQYDFPFIEDYRRGLAFVTARKAEQEALEEANGRHNQGLAERAYQAFLTAPDRQPADRINELVEELTGEELKAPAAWFPSDHAGFAAEIKRRRAIEEDARKAAEKAKEDAEAAKAQAKTDYINTWIAANASPAIQKQHQDDLLTRADAIRLIADAAFDALGVPQAHRVTMCQDDSCACGIKDVNGIPTEVYERWLTVAGLLPDNVFLEFEVARDCERDADGYYDADGAYDRTGLNDGAGKSYYTAMIKLPVGPFIFQRRIKI